MRRLFWVALGVGFGAASAIVASRWTRRQVQRAKPQALVAESVEEGKRAAEERERELRSKHDVPGTGAA